jgi:hypothetical protein
MNIILETGVADFTTEQLAALMDGIGKPVAAEIESRGLPGLANAVRVCWRPTGYTPRLHIRFTSTQDLDGAQIGDLFTPAMSGLKSTLDHMLFDEEVKKRATISWG